MKAISMFAGRKTSWELKFMLKSEETGTVVEVRASDGDVLKVSCDEMLRITIYTRWSRKTGEREEKSDFSFTLTSPCCEGEIRIVWYEFSFRLFVNGLLEDEEWPLGELAGQEWTVYAVDSIEGLAFTSAINYEKEEERVYTEPFQNFVLPGHNTGVGDCMPFSRDGRYCLYYLFDRRSHQSKCGLGAHQWAQISSADLKTWRIHPMAVGITEQWEGSICTGSLIQKDSQIYAFYAVRMSDGSPARLTWAVSSDGIKFEKSGRYFALAEPYEPVSARDPMVFWGADGQYHMLVTTSIVEGGQYGGCLAHLTSYDLKDWIQHAPFIVPGYSDQPECSDYFEWNGWYYLVFSNFAIARYRMSRKPFGPWIKPENDLLDALEVQVPKTAAYGNRRFSTGFLARRPRTYAGNAITHELFQRADGTLGICQIEEILPKVNASYNFEDMFLNAGQNRDAAEISADTTNFRLKAVMKPGKENGIMGIRLIFGNNDMDVTKSYQIEMDIAARTVVIIRPDEDFQRGSGRDLLTNVMLKDGVEIDLLVSRDIMDLMISDGRGMTMRLDEFTGVKSKIEFYTIANSLSVSKISLGAM